MTNKELDIWFDLFLETEGFEDDVLRPLHDRLGTKIFKYNKETGLWDWTGKNFRLTFEEKSRLSYFNENLDEYDERRVRILKYYKIFNEN